MGHSTSSAAVSRVEITPEAETKVCAHLRFTSQSWRTIMFYLAVDPGVGIYPPSDTLQNLLRLRISLERVPQVYHRRSRFTRRAARSFLRTKDRIITEILGEP